MKLQQIAPVISAISVTVLAIVGIVNSDRLMVIVEKIEKNTQIHYGEIALLLVFALAILLIFITMYFFKETMFSQWAQFHVMGMRGAWSKKPLDKQINRLYKRSGEIKIKVTRGYNYFLQDNDNFYKCLRGSIGGSYKNIKLLMLAPCMKFEQIRKRAETNVLDHPIEYIETIFEVLIELNSITNDTNNPNRVTIKFYGEKHVGWRFFIFSGLKSKTIFAAQYKGDHPSNEVPMLKGRSGNISLCDSFDGYFDEIFNSNEDSVISRRFINNDFAQKNNAFTQCKDCSERNKCLAIKEKYKDRLG
uniref:Uncharacterized protein n=1 Tax=Candidatus Kentrum sp. LPFa TaxID=2126335 RepID=A0A450W5H3_9GAMM|nr:MAG: hypothetical protein BECKLPF1236B_GA0070989_103315 [Candidatus Kentron sp. LPFa]